MSSLYAHCIRIGCCALMCCLACPAVIAHAQDPTAPDAATPEEPVETSPPEASTEPIEEVATPEVETEAVVSTAPEMADNAEQMVVTGTRRSARTVVDSNVPIDVVKLSDMRNAPSPDLNDKLTLTVPSFKVDRVPVLDGATFNRPATLRGLSPDQTLVLINGKRRHRSAYIDVMNQGSQAVDLAQIPLIAIKRLEVLRDGASAQYGSDAIAGVINIILEDAVGYRAYAQYARYYEGDGNSVLGAVSGGWALGDRGHLRLSVEGSFGQATSRSVQRPDAAELIAMGNTAVRQPVTTRWGQPDLRGALSFLDASYNLTDDVELYAFANFGYRWGESDFYYRRPTQPTVFTSPQMPALFDTNFATLPQRYQDWYRNNPAVLSGYPGGFTPRFSMTTLDGSAVAGVRGKLADKLHWDLSGRYGQNWIDYHIRNTINASQGPDSATAFNAGDKRQTEIAGNLDLSYPWEIGLVEPLNIAFGAEVRREQYTAGLGDPGSYAVGPLSVIGLAGGSNGYFGTGPLQAGTWARQSIAGYVDVDADFTRWLNLAAAARVENYFGTGATANGKLAGRIEPIERFSIRGAVSTGFRAATPGQQNLTNTRQAPSADGSEIQTTGTIPSNNPIAMLKGGEQLKPEKSLNFSVGFVAQPLRNLTLTVDFYHIDVRDRISLSQRYELTDAERTQLLASGVAAADGLTQFNFFVNGYRTRTQGLDVVLAYKLELSDRSYLNFTGVVNLNRTKVVSFSPGVINDFSRQYIEERLPKHVENLMVEYKLGPFSVTVRGRHYGSWTEPYSDETDEQGRLWNNELFGSEMFFDLMASYQFQAVPIRVSLGAENIFNNYPGRARFPNTPEDAAAGRPTTVGRLYPTVLPYDADGGRLYARLDMDF
jgi:iron complex outermembrane recepter protein